MYNYLDQRLLRLLIILLPFHYFIFTIILNDLGFLKYWKEGIILLVFLIIVLKEGNEILKNKQCELTLFDVSIFFFIIPVLFSFFFLTTDKNDGLYMLRVYLQPFLIYFIFRNIRMTEIQFNKFIHIVFNVGIVLSLYGLFQAIILGDQFLIKLGYMTKYEGRLLDSYYISGFGNFQRVVSTFVNANVCAIYLSFSLILVFINSQIFTKRKFIFGSVIILIAILFTFSRSTWIPLLFVLIYIVNYLKRVYPSLKKYFLTLPFLLILFISFFSYILNLNVLEKLYLFIYRTLTLQDTSVAGRSDIWSEAFNIVKNNIFGIGMGHTGAKAMVLGNDIISSESSYLTIFLDFGIQGFISFLLLFIFSIKVSFNNRKTYKNHENLKLLNTGCILATSMIMISMFASNYIHDIELFTIYYIIIGLGSNRYLYNSIIKTENKGNV